MAIVDRFHICRVALVLLGALWLGSCGGGGATDPAGVAGADAAALGLPSGFVVPTDAQATGVFAPLTDWPSSAHNAILAPDGRVLGLGANATDPGLPVHDLWNPSDGSHHALTLEPRGDLSCAAQVMLGDGRSIAVTGAGRQADSAAGRISHDASYLVDPAEHRIEPSRQMQRERRCAAATLLPGGEIYIQGGISERNGADRSDRPEIRATDGSVRLLTGVDTGRLAGRYPRNFVAPDGGIFGFDDAGTMYHVDPAGDGSITFNGQLGPASAGGGLSGAMFVPGRILQYGSASTGAVVIDIDTDQPALVPTSAPERQRRHSMATILADGQVLASGGFDATGTAAAEVEIWHPATRRWSVAARPAGPRPVRTNALLLPDATVLLFGGSAASASDAAAAGGGAAIFHPPYLFTSGGRAAERPALTEAPAAVDPGRSAQLSASGPRPISRITLVRGGSVMHGFDAGQRFVDLPFSRSGNVLQVQLPERASEVPPGIWMMFAIDDLGVPSKAKLVRVNVAGAAAAADRARRPYLGSPGNQSSAARSAVRLQLGASDPNGDRLVYSASGLPAGLSLDPDSGLVTGSALAAGIHAVTIAVSDGVHGASASFDWTVTGASAPDRRLAAAAAASAAAGQLPAGIGDKRALNSHEPCGNPVNDIVRENCLTGNLASEWDISGAGNSNLQGFATDISVNRGSRISFKVSTPASAYRYDIYRMGYYGGRGARKIATVLPSASLPQNQPNCLSQASTGLVDCGNWAVSGYWDVPANAVSGIYFAKLVRTDGTSGSSHIVFIVRDDASRSELLFQTADTTWQAYNSWGGNSMYTGSPAGRAYKISYNRPFNTRGIDGGQDWVFNAEYPMVRWLEANGYDVSYVSGIDTDRFGGLLLNHKTFVSVGHDEYWSGQQRTNVEAARAAGVHLAFFSGNEVFWKTRWENSIDGSGTPYRTLVNYKETHASAKIDPNAAWTGTWRDPRFSPPSDGGRPENALTGTWFRVNSGTRSIVVPAADGKMRLWRNTSIATLAAGASATLPNGTLGYEWDTDEDNGFRPPGLIRLSTTNATNLDLLLDHGSRYGSGSATHALTMYRHASGARVFGAGTIQWSWGLDANHDRAGTPSDVRMQQATVNLLADMDAQPGSLQAGLVPATASTDAVPPSSTITSPAAGSIVAPGSNVTISGTAIDGGGGVVGGVEVSVDGGNSWHPASGRGSWSYSWTPNGSGPATLRTRAADDSGNLEAPGAGVTVNIGTGPPQTCPCTIFPASAAPAQLSDNDPAAVNLGMRFRSDVAGHITAIRFYKGPANTGTHRGALWSASGQQLANVTFSGESASGWQQANLATPVAIAANTVYVVSYHAPNGQYSGDDYFFQQTGVNNPPLHALRDGESGANGVYLYGSALAFPTQTYRSENYWVDVVFATSAPSDTTPPSVLSTAPASGATGVARTAIVSAAFSEPMNAATISGSTFSLAGPGGTPVGGAVSYDATSRTAILTPAAQLDASTTYTARVTTGASDAAGNPMAADRVWSFTTEAADTTPPSVTSAAPAGGATGVVRTTAVSAVFNEPMTAATISGSTFSLVNPAGTPVGATVSYNATSRTATLTPGAVLDASTTYTARITTGVRDAAGNPMAADRVWSFTTEAVGTTSCPCTIFPASAAPAQLSDNDPAAVNLGMRFRSDVAGHITAIRFYKGPANTGTHRGALWSASGQQLANVTFSGESASGWQQANLATPVAIAANTVYVVSYHAPNGQYSGDDYFFQQTGVNNPPLHALRDGESGANGVYLYGSALAFPTQTYRSENYWVDVVFATSAPSDTTPPSVLSTAPASGATGVARTAIVSAAFSEPMNAATISGSTFSLAGPGGTPVGGAVSYDATSRTAILTPAAQLDASTTYTARVTTGASDAAGNPMAADRVWSFTTEAADTTPPSVTSTVPAGGATGVVRTTAVSAVFNEPMTAATISGSTFSLVNPAGTPVGATVSYNATSRTATLTPGAVLDASTTYTARITTGVRDAAGNPMAADRVWSFTTEAAGTTSCPCTIWPASTVPAVASDGETSAVNLGVKFRSDVNGFITGIRFYKGPGNTGTHVGSLWSSSGAQLASATFSGETASGWQQVNFTSPVAVTANTVYVASYFAPSGRYAINANYFNSSGFANAPLHALQNGVSGGNGVYAYAAAPAFPTSTWQSANYWVDVVFTTSAP